MKKTGVSLEYPKYQNEKLLIGFTKPQNQKKESTHPKLIDNKSSTTARWYSF